MFRRLVGSVLVLGAGLAAVATSEPAAAQYRGMPAGWPYNTGGYYATAGVGTNRQAYYVARPVVAARAGAPVAYVPVNAAYVNPNYFGTYATARTAYRPPVAGTAYYPQATAAYYAPPATTAYYPQAAPQAAYPQATVNYAPGGSYAVSPAGSVHAGSEAATIYGQPTTVNYVPPRVVYRPAYAAAPVYAYQPVTAYQVGAAPVTCHQPVAAVAAVPTCPKPRCGGLLSWLNPFNWFRPRCGAAPVATTTYCAPVSCHSVSQCGTASGCGQQPYYPAPATTVIPTVPYVPPAAIIPSIRSPIVNPPTVPPPPTRVVPPADSRPSLSPGGSFPVGPSSTPSGSFGAPPAGGSFGSGSNYPPDIDPYQGPNISGSSYRGSGNAASRDAASSDTASSETAIREPAGRDLAPTVHPLADPDARQPQQAPSRAPQLLNPRDKTASKLNDRWAVVPAVWPVKAGGEEAAQPLAEASPYIQNVRHRDEQRHYEPVRHFVPAANEATFDDGGWRSAR